MSAVIAGIDSLTVVPFDKQYKTPGEFSERMARNQQLLLKEESDMDKIVDPAGGSYYIETLTVAIAQEGWKVFLAVEDNGGFGAQVEAGEVQKAVNASASKRHTDVARRKEDLLGTNQFPNFNEMATEKITKEACACKCGCVAETGLDKLPAGRAAEAFESLRLATEAAAKRPKAFMLTIGNLAMRLARSQFSCNFFACAGYEVIDNLGFATVEDGVAAAQAAGADIIVLCSSDDEYAELAVPAFKAIDGKQIFVVAGAPACMEDLQAAGIENFIHVRVNVLETLKAFNKQLGI
jgi:methylmalonyl-CoA mutase